MKSKIVAKRYSVDSKARQIVRPVAPLLQVEVFLDYTDAGSGFLYGYLGSKEKPPFDLKAIANKSSLAFEVAEAINQSHSFNTVFIFKSLSVLYFVSFFLSMLFYLGAMQWAIEKVGWILQVP